MTAAGARDLEAIFAAARAVSIEAVVGADLWRSGQRMRGPCPLCGASQGKRADGAFSVDPAAGLFKCWACGEAGDVISLERALRGGSPLEAAERLAGGPRPAPRAARPSSSSSADPGRDLAARIWRGCAGSRISETPAAAYLAGRGLAPATIAAIGRGWRFNPRATWGADPDGRSIVAPALVGLVASAEGPTGGVHLTYLSADCRGRADLAPSKKMFGPQRSAAGLAGGVWLIGSPARCGPGGGELVVGEGLESSLSAWQLLEDPAASCLAAGSLGALQGGALVDREGRLEVEPDPRSPALTWPGVERVAIAVDRDMRPIPAKARNAAGGVSRIRLDAEARARLCGGLAVAAWRAAGASRVRVIAPAAGRDFNDELRARGG